MEETFDDEIQRLHDEAEWKKIQELELEFSMRRAYSMIEEMGWTNWIERVNMEEERKRTIVQNMLKWHLEREEYERCSFLQEGLIMFK
jgi:hypothetical protein